MWLLPKDLAALYRLKTREAEEEADATCSDRTASIEQCAKQVKAILHFLQIQIESRGEELIAQQPLMWRYSYDGDRAQFVPQEPTDTLINIPSALALFATSTNNPWP